MSVGTIHKIISLLQTALDTLGASVEIREVERIGFLVHEAMSVEGRRFHTPEHIFDLVDPAAPHSGHAALAAMFHDLVYYTVDHGFTVEVAAILDPYIVVGEGSVAITHDIPAEDRAFWGCASVFGYEPGQTLPSFGGLNEFLSALVMDVLFHKSVPDKDLLIATACIEATIPFRGGATSSATGTAADAAGPAADRGAEGGASPSEALAARLRTTAERFDLGLTEAEIVGAVEAAVRFANRDVWNFGEEDVGRFLDNTWKLLPESNPALRTGGVYTVTSYRTALQKMEGFMRTLDPRTIFSRYGDAPAPDEYERSVELATRNVAVGSRYLGIKLLTAGILEGLALLSGGDAPVSYLMGAIDAGSKRLADYLPEIAPDPPAPIDPVLRDLLAVGRASASGFDMQNSPLSLFVYRVLGDSGVEEHLTRARRMFGGTESPRRFVQSLPEELVAPVARAMAEMAFTRKALLLDLTVA